MKNWWLIGWLVLACGCCSYSVRCGKHLHPINGTSPPAASGASTAER